jgi:hypothetical protein
VESGLSRLSSCHTIDKGIEWGIIGGKQRGGGEMEDRIKMLESLVGVLVEEVRRMREELGEMRLLLERLSGRKLRRVDGRIEGRRLEIGDLSSEELEVLKIFFDWLRGNWERWKASYEEGYMEGYDSKRGLVLLRRGTMREFLDRVVELGYSKQGVLKLLGDLGILRYWDKEGKRQYCIAVRITKPMRSVASGYYVLGFERVREVGQGLRSYLEVRGRVKRAGIDIEERLTAGFLIEGGEGASDKEVSQ